MEQLESGCKVQRKQIDFEIEVSPPPQSHIGLKRVIGTFSTSIILLSPSLNRCNEAFLPISMSYLYGYGMF